MNFKMFLLIFLPHLYLSSQVTLTTAMLEDQAYRFVLRDDLTFTEEAASIWHQWIGDDQFVGLAEVHRTTQLSYFTTALLPVLKEKGFDSFALELGPNSADILNEFKSTEGNMGNHIKALNRKYGKKSISKTPLIFVNKKAHSLFMDKATKLDYRFWGLDQEFGFAYEMLVDRIYNSIENPSKEVELKYKAAKKILRKNIFKNKKEGIPIGCWYQSNKELNDFLNASKGLKPEVDRMINDIRVSWDIYCKSGRGQQGSVLRAEYMKSNMNTYLEPNPNAKVFLKFGSAHLTHGVSPFGVDDLGKYVDEKALENKSGFLSIYQIIAYRNGKNMLNDAGWKHLNMFLELGRKNQWTAIDLRPIREKLISGQVSANETYAYKIMNYDILLITPDDSYDKPNY